MGIRARKSIALKVVGLVAIIVAFVVLRYLADPQRVAERHVKAMHTLYEDMQQNPSQGAEDPRQIAWNGHVDGLVRLGYLDRVEHIVPFGGDSAAQARLYAALDEKKRTYWLSDWNYRPGSGQGVVITVVDEGWRQADWKDTIDMHRLALEE